MSSLREEPRLRDAVETLEPRRAGARLRVRERHARPPMERTPAIAGLAERARALASGIGLRLDEGDAGASATATTSVRLGFRCSMA